MSMCAGQHHLGWHLDKEATRGVYGPGLQILTRWPHMWPLHQKKLWTGISVRRTYCRLISLVNSFFFFFFFLLDMFIQHTAFLLDKGSQDRRRGILPPAVSIYWYGLLFLILWTLQIRVFFTNISPTSGNVKEKKDFPVFMYYVC